MTGKTRQFVRAGCFGLAVFTLGCSLIAGAQSTAAPEPTATAEEASPTDAGPEIQPEEPTEEPIEEPAPVLPQFSCGDMTLGFIQTGPEGAWRDANTASFKETAAGLGVHLIFYNAQNSLMNQQTAFRNFIDGGGVNVIVLAALDSSGWDSLHQDAMGAGKVVVLEDRKIDASENLYATFVGSDFIEEGRKAADAMCTPLEGSAKKNVVELAGDTQSTIAIDRGRGFREKMGDCGITITQFKVGNWNAQSAKAAMKSMLQQSKDVQGVFGQNDDTALGAIQAIQEAGPQPGKDINLVFVDGTKAAFQSMVDGKLNATVECSPWIGPQAFEAALQALNGETSSQMDPNQ
jgi:ABC-type sugar transport system substrate-binding protein